MEENNYSEKSWIKTLLLCWVAGIFGVHRFYVGKKKTGAIQLITLGGLGIWALIDLYLIGTQNFCDYNENQIKNNDRRLSKIVAIIFLILCIINIYMVINGIKSLKELEIFNNDNVIENIDIDANIEIFIEPSANNEEIKKLKLEIEKIEGISSIEFVSKEAGAKEYMAKYGDKAYLFEKYMDTIPDSYVIKIRNIELAEEISNRISKLSNVKNVTNGYESLQIVNRQKNIIMFEKMMINIVFVYSILWIMELAIIGIEILNKENRLRKNLEV